TTIADYEKMWKKHKVCSLDWENKKEVGASSVRYLKMQPQEKVVEITTKESNRKLVATVDHPFYSETRGKTRLGSLVVGDRVAVLPLEPVQFEEAAGKTILTEQDIITACPEKTDREYIVRELRDRGLVPFRDDDERLLKISRLAGHLFGDGSLTISMKKYKSACALVFSGTAVDLEEIRRDIEAIGFTASKQSVYRKESVLDDGRIIAGYTRRIDCYSKPLWVLLSA
ncbi:MAG: hypothetical protein NTW59_02165, partial [Candidatus Diapherotrites archaeon]|nr:hypothetical protein [Candidatus Diapherotrites archaeon]